MSTASNVEARIQSVSVSDDVISAQLVDGRTIIVPLAWSWRLSEATAEQRANSQIIGSGSGIRWPDIDEDISVEGMLHGIPARKTSRRLQTTLTRWCHHEWRHRNHIVNHARIVGSN